jgi:hypothetical protein
VSTELPSAIWSAEEFRVSDRRVAHAREVIVDRAAEKVRALPGRSLVS